MNEKDRWLINARLEAQRFNIPVHISYDLPADGTLSQTIRVYPESCVIVNRRPGDTPLMDSDPVERRAPHPDDDLGGDVNLWLWAWVTIIVMMTAIYCVTITMITRFDSGPLDDAHYEIRYVGPGDD